MRRSVASALAAALALALPAASQDRDLRTVEVVDYDCSSDIGRRRMTLFANGTVRLKIRENEEDRMLLKELAPERLAGYLNRLREIDLSESEDTRESPSGDWIQQCELVLDRLDAGVARFSFSRYDSVSLALSRVISIAEELAIWAEEQAVTAEFPPGYEPQPGDVLERRDGVLFEVVALTADQRGVELRGVEQPLVVYVLRAELIGEFVAVVERRGEP